MAPRIICFVLRWRKLNFTLGRCPLLGELGFLILLAPQGRKERVLFSGNKDGLMSVLHLLNSIRSWPVRWFKPNLRSSLGLLGPPVASSQLTDKAKTDEIRERMLDLLGANGAMFFPHTVQRLQHAPDVDHLWHMRPNLMAALAAIYGEEAARLQLATVTGMFDGFLPRPLKPRPSPLGLR